MPVTTRSVLLLQRMGLSVSIVTLLYCTIVCVSDAKCQEESIPMSLLALVAMIINGPNIEAQSSASSMPQPILTIAQLLMYNSFIRRRINLTSTSTYRHNQERETPLPIY